jgi:2'-5' RNA ligase
MDFHQSDHRFPGMVWDNPTWLSPKSPKPIKAYLGILLPNHTVHSQTKLITPPKNPYHITVIAPFAYPDHELWLSQISQLCAGCKPIDVTEAGITIFPTVTEVSLIASETLKEFHRMLRAIPELRQGDQTFQGDRYTPHVTVGELIDPTQPVYPELAVFQPESWTIDCLTLFLKIEGQPYTPAVHWKLGG